ncbi:flavodoxin family protein [Clostridium botulinum]|uniref:flavodoxin family protein n=1 Tax=Clostridium botulinum TaxID=1491 RepID=UPI00016BC0E4|nr:flavodoxin family protein [Clostridium botulinum]AJE09338.1 NADPH-dependent FMN reductase family protein [Clostridium botulinum CDC_1436]APU59781.1 NADPH-dependent FMN reductase family protein [Clostridium botulinum]EEZ28424.1 PrdB protein [Clostridium botulinum Bf]WCJ74217.1 flavodoxin family protein [Clostridium botulinum]WCJ78056.1 flavodoxin family protein [Clostridium botulinum]
MKALILTGSPHPHGTTAFLADEFSIGAKEAGHEVVRFDTAKLEIDPCIGCYYCRKNDGRCVYDDDMSQIYPHLMTADAVVLVTPLYYFSMTAQLKRTIDRFFAVNPVLRDTQKNFT